MASSIDKSKTGAASMANATRGRKTSFKSKAEALEEVRSKQADLEIAEALLEAAKDDLQKAENAAPKRMTDAEYAAEQAELLKDIPEEFKGTLSYMAYERGHSSGPEECISILRDLVSDLAEPIKKYGERKLLDGLRAAK
jgi:hypothetical protein